MRRILVTSASDANGDGYGTVLSFSADGVLARPFSDDPRITDPRGMSLSPAGDLVYVTRGDDRVLALSAPGTSHGSSGGAAGTTPHQWLLAQRLALAQRLLETTDLPIDQVAASAGFGTPAAMRLQFQQALDTSPASYRRTFHTSSATGPQAVWLSDQSLAASRHQGTPQ
jgi:hypothetical protein